MKLLWSEKKQAKQVNTIKSSGTDLERRFASRIANDISNAESSKQAPIDDTDLSIEQNWDDEYLLYKGGGLQWSSSLAYRTKATRKVRPNSEDNFIFNAIQIQVANITANTPEISIDANQKRHKEHAEKVTYISKYNDEKNNFTRFWHETVTEFCAYGCAIAKVTWDDEWMGGTGPDRWIGDVRLSRVDKKEFFPDPAITDLENRMNECSYIIHRYRKKLDWIKQTWEDTALNISEDSNQDLLKNEGGDPGLAYVYEYWHRGYPEFMPTERSKELRERALLAEEVEDYYKANDLHDMSTGNLEGIHVAYYCNNQLLEYRPYEYDHGNYPFSFAVRYRDENTQWGWGEIRNIKIPQILHNKADEIEMEAMSREGLGGGYYTEGSISPKQLEAIKTNTGKGGMWFGVNNIAGLRFREGVRVPGSVTSYKEHKQRMIETISSNTAIVQGVMPSAQMPFKAIAELGARTDVRVKATANKLEEFLKQIYKLRIPLFGQFYTEERYYRLKGTDNKVVEGTFKNEMMFDAWAREMVQTGTDEIGQPIMEQKYEIFIPDFDIDVNVINSKPNDRNYYTNIAMTMYDRQLLTMEDLWKVLEDGKLPTVDEILQHLQEKQQQMSQAQQPNLMPSQPPQDEVSAMQQQPININEMIGLPQGQQLTDSIGPYRQDADFGGQLNKFEDFTKGVDR